jgi:hypothetical protein
MVVGGQRQATAALPPGNDPVKGKGKGKVHPITGHKDPEGE